MRRLLLGAGGDCGDPAGRLSVGRGEAGGGENAAVYEGAACLSIMSMHKKGYTLEQIADVAEIIELK